MAEIPAEARHIIGKLGLVPHPEGGWFRETWRAPAPEGERAAGTAIHFLLEKHQRSHWHRVDAAEVWLWHGGDPLLLDSAPADVGPVATTRLGPDVLSGEAVQAVIPAHHWQAARPAPGGAAGWTLASCVVTPGFDFAGFELAPDGWSPGG